MLVGVGKCESLNNDPWSHPVTLLQSVVIIVPNEPHKPIQIVRVSTGMRTLNAIALAVLKREVR